MEYNYEALKALRKHTNLNLIEKLKIIREKELAEDTQVMINKIERCYIGVDYTEAEMLEFSYRLKSWYKKSKALYAEYGNNRDFYEFSNDMLNRIIESEKAKTIKKLK